MRAIDTDKLIDDLNFKIPYKSIEGKPYVRLEDVVRVVNKSPAITARTVRPQWHHRWLCNCGYAVDSPIGAQNYCQDCGAKLDYGELTEKCRSAKNCGENCGNCPVAGGLKCLTAEIALIGS